MQKQKRKIMNAQKKARDLVDSFKSLVPIEFGGMAQDLAKQCAIIAVDEILEIYRKNWQIENSEWIEVRQEIEKL